MISIDFTRTRTQATRDAQASLAAAPTTWTWSEKTAVQWDTDLTTLDQLKIDESAKRTQWRNAAELWQADVDRIQQMTRDVVRKGTFRFRSDPVKLQLFEVLKTDATSRSGVYEQGLAARDAWQEVDPTWQLSTADSLGSFSSLLTNSLARQSAESAKFTAWRRASAALTNKARLVDEDAVAWYAEAIRQFPAGTTEGDMIRSTVQTTTRPETEVAQAVISNLLVNGGEIHSDVAAEGATRFTFLQQSPGSPAFVVVLADSTEAHLSLTGQPAGLHRFKAFGSNSGGSGPESAIVEATVSVAQAA
jgi:hypothetical protein